MKTYTMFMDWKNQYSLDIKVSQINLKTNSIQNLSSKGLSFPKERFKLSSQCL